MGIQSIRYVLESIPSDEIYIILNKDLEEYNFDTLTHHLVNKKYTYVYLDRQTRGPVETAFLGVQKLNFANNEQICFFDNDTIYNFKKTDFPTETFIGYSSLLHESQDRPYCFLEVENDRLVRIAEKVKISNNYASGVYSFKNVEQFLDVSKNLLKSDYSFNNEFYMSLLYNILLKSNYPVIAFNIPEVVCLGTYQDISCKLDKIPNIKLRICFDIDNTIIKYRRPDQSYLECEVVEKNIFFLRKLKELGHTIILYTARGMRTSKGNCGIAMKNVAKDTFESLEKNNIPFDEIYFGKPDADIYIDDKAFNPYINLFESIGFGHFQEEFLKTYVSHNSSNKFNNIFKKGSEIIKNGPISSMKGEIYFYETISKTPIYSFFPNFKWASIEDANAKLCLEFIRGFTIYDLLKDGLFTAKYLDQILNNFDIMHTYSGISIDITKDDIYQNYMGKLKKRILNKKDYPFQNTDELVKRIDDGVKEYLYNENVYPVSVVHGDPWFSNTLLTSTNNIVFLDMKGDINGKLTTNGDALTDFGKIYQSILGFDYIINGNTNVDTEYMKYLSDKFINEIEKRGYKLKDLNIITACLISKTLSFLDVTLEIRSKLWKIVENLCIL
jgi:capsule biosynthesis phosphatase